jgi:hypothetical protein
MTLTPQTACTILDLAHKLPAQWCVYEVWLHDPDKDAATLVYINAAALRDVTLLLDLNRNTHWHSITKPSSYIYLKIVQTGEKLDCRNEAFRHMMAQEPKPPCNMHGHDAAAGRSITCSNGVTYETQTHAAEALGIKQSQISQHLRGRVPSVKGYTFSYKRTV